MSSVAEREPVVLPDCPRPEEVDLSCLAEGILGYKALKVAQQLTAPITVTARVRGGDTRFDSTLPDDRPTRLRKALAATRGKVAEMSDVHKAGFDTTTTAHLNRERAAQGQPEVETAAWSQWIQDAADTELLPFLAWNAGRIEAKQKDPSVIRQIELEKARYDAAVRVRIRRGLFHEQAEEGLGLLGGVAVRLSDYTDMAAQSRSGYAWHGKAEAVYVAEPDEFWLSPESRKTVRHEVNHALLGKLSTVFRDETVTEFIALALSDDRWWTLDPDAHKMPGSYRGCRFVAHALDLPVDLLMQAYTARTEEAREATRDRLEGHIVASRQAKAHRRIDATLRNVEQLAVSNDTCKYNAVDTLCDAMLVGKKPAKIEAAITHGNVKASRKFLREIGARSLPKLYN